MVAGRTVLVASKAFRKICNRNIVYVTPFEHSKTVSYVVSAVCILHCSLPAARTIIIMRPQLYLYILLHIVLRVPLGNVSAIELRDASRGLYAPYRTHPVQDKVMLQPRRLPDFSVRT